MRMISEDEAALVSGAGAYCPPVKEKGNNGFGNGGNDGVPGNSGFEDVNR